MPPIWPMTQLLGSCFGQEASTLNCGGPSAACAPAITVALLITAATSILRIVIGSSQGRVASSEWRVGKPTRYSQFAVSSLWTHVGYEFLDALSGIDLARIEIALRIDRERVHPVELPGLASAGAERVH